MGERLEVEGKGRERRGGGKEGERERERVGERERDRDRIAARDTKIYIHYQCTYTQCTIKTLLSLL